jgi:hypothetical protein
MRSWQKPIGQFVTPRGDEVLGALLTSLEYCNVNL